MESSPKQQLAIYEASILSAEEAAGILLETNGERAFAAARARLLIVAKMPNELGILFWNKVLCVLLDRTDAGGRPG